LCFLAALARAARELAPLGRCQEGPVADRADVELEGILGGLGLRGRRDFLVLGVALFGLFDLGRVVLYLFRVGLLSPPHLGHELEPRLHRGVRGHVRKRPHATGIGAAERTLERSVNPLAKDVARRTLRNRDPLTRTTAD